MFSFATRGDLSMAAELGGHRTELEVDVDALELRVPSANAVADIRTFLAEAVAHDIQVTDIAIVAPTLDDVFLTLTGRDGAHHTTTRATSARTKDEEKAA